MPVDINSPDPVLNRLRQLEGRLHNLGVGDSPAIEPIRNLIAKRESNRGKAYSEILRNAASFALDVTQSIDAKVAARLNSIGDRAIAILEAPTPHMELERVEKTLDDQEARVNPLAHRFTELRQSAIKIEERLALAGDALNQIWKQQEPTGLGRWRMVMRSVSAKVELEKQAEPSFVDQFRAAPSIEQHISPPASKIVCGRCNRAALHRVKRVSLLEEVLRMVLLAPYRCRSCGEHSYHLR